MDETVILSQICPKQNNDQSQLTDPTPHDIFLVVNDYKEYRNRLLIVQLDPEISEVAAVGHIPYLHWPSVVVPFAGSIFCFGDEQFSGLLHEFDLLKRTARTPTQLLEPVRWTASAASNHELIVSGGFNRFGRTIAACCVYAPAKNSWTSMRQLRQARRSHQICWLSDGRVFAIGGIFEGGSILSSVEMVKRAWIPAPKEESSTEWQYVAPMKKTRYNFGCCIVEGRIVVAGGWTGNGDTWSVDSFEPPTSTNTGQWTSLTNLASEVNWCFLVPSAGGLVLIVCEYGEIQLGRRKAQMASFEWDPWTWELRPQPFTAFCRCWGSASLSSAAVSKR